MAICIPPFYIGQEIIAIKNHSQGFFKKGDEFIVTGIIKTCCSFSVSVGITATTDEGQCMRCGAIYKLNSESLFNSHCFAPKIETDNFISMKEFTLKQLEYIGAN
jgi:hypothetical protein